MKILLISPFFSPDVGGVETMLSNFCNFLANQKYTVIVITYNPLIVKEKAKFREKINNYVEIIRIPWPGFGLFNIFERFPIIQFFYLVPALTITVLVFLLLPKRRPDIIHSFGLSAAFAGGLASQIYGIPSIVDMCTVYRFSERPMLSWFVHKLLNMSDFIRGNNLSGKLELQKMGINLEKLGIITPPVNEIVFRPMPQDKVRKKIGLPQNKFVALFVGRMVESKNVDVAIGATSMVKNLNVSFVFVGEGPLRRLVEEAAEKDDRIIIVNTVKYHDLAHYYNAADILMCAAVDKNLISFVGREALLCGLPILTLNVATYAGIPYKVDKNLIPLKIGHLTDPTSQAVAIYLNKLINQKERKGIIPFNRSDCVQYGIENFSQRAMDWIGDSYEKTKELSFIRMKK